MKKYFPPITLILLVSNISFGQKRDTTILFFKAYYGRVISVSSIEEADYFRMVLPPDSGDDRHNIQEYYRSGKIKFIGKEYYTADTFDPLKINILFDGDCISYFENGKRSNISHFKNGNKIDLEYSFYPSGRVYCCLKHNSLNTPVFDNQLSWECYDLSGKLTCENGNGKWLVYDNNYQNLELTGQVLNGLREGIWRGSITIPDSISYQYQFKNGRILSSMGYDKRSVPHPFKIAREPATYRTGQINFIDILQSRIKIPRDIEGRKMTLDTARLSFVVEKDGHIDEFDMPGEVNSLIKDAVFDGLKQCDHWTPYKLYGIPFRTKITIPIKEITGYSDERYHKFIGYEERVLKDN